MNLFLPRFDKNCNLIPIYSKYKILSYLEKFCHAESIREIRSGSPQELLYANDLKLGKQLRAWKGDWRLGNGHCSQKGWK